MDELVALRATVGLLEETRDHGRAVELMRDTALADGCSAQDYAVEVTELMRDHVPWLERPLAGEALGKFIVKPIPEMNASEGRLLVRELTTVAGALGDHSVVIRRCVAIVRESESAAARAVGLAARAQG